MYNQWRALNLCMSLMATHNTLQQYNSGAENRLKAQLKKLDANIDKQQKIIDNPKTKVIELILMLNSTRCMLKSCIRLSLRSSTSLQVVPPP